MELCSKHHSFIYLITYIHKKSIVTAWYISYNNKTAGVITVDLKISDKKA
jgi:hypothetical protein